MCGIRPPCMNMMVSYQIESSPSPIKKQNFLKLREERSGSIQVSKPLREI